MAHSHSHMPKSGAAKLSQDMATLINNRQGSDIQFKVGGGETYLSQENDEANYDESTTVILYAHSVILRCRSQYFATMLDEERDWKESKGVICKPNISPGTFQDVLYYIYTGNVRAKASENIFELIAAADEMDLEEVSTECQAELIRIVEYIFSDENNSDDKSESVGEMFKGSTKQRIPIDVAIHTHIIPALDLANSLSLSPLFQRLLEVILPNISIIIKSPDAYTTFLNNISSEVLTEIIASDKLAIAERSVWDLALTWACHQTNLQKAAVEARLASLGNDNKSNDEGLLDGVVINDDHLVQLKVTLAPLLPVIRFSLLDPDDYAQMVNILNYFLPYCRLFDLTRHFMPTIHMRQLDAARIGIPEGIISSKIIVNSTTRELLRKSIFETGGISRCSSFRDLKFLFLFRASEHGFSARTFHQYCDNKGPTLTLIKSTDGHLFGGVNFAHWYSNCSGGFYYSSPLSFLFALPDGRHRKNMLIFKNVFGCSSYNDINYGPTFGHGHDLCIADSANSRRSYSRLPSSYKGNEASDTALAGAEYFTVVDYEVFAISKK